MLYHRNWGVLNMYELYTDAAVSKGNAVATCFLLGSDNYLGYNSFEYQNISSSLHSELLGIRDGLRYAKQVGVQSTDILTVYSDSNSAIQLITKQKEDPTVPRKFKNIVTDINSECEGMLVSFRLIQGHQTNHNPNKVVDLSSNTILRYRMGRR